MCHCLLDRVLKSSGRENDKERCGFRRNRSCSDRKCVVRKSSETTKETKNVGYLAFMNLRKVYDIVYRDHIASIRDLWIGRNVLAGIKSFVELSGVCVRVVGNVSSC